MIMKMFGKQNLNFKSRFFQSECFQQRSGGLLIIAMLFVHATTGVQAVVSPTVVNTSFAVSSLAYPQQLNYWVQQVNATKAILDDVDVHPTAQQQKQALCQRIQAYQQIVQLTQQYPDAENAALLVSIAQLFLQRQQQSLQQSGMHISTFCAAPVTRLSSVSVQDQPATDER